MYDLVISEAEFDYFIFTLSKRDSQGFAYSEDKAKCLMPSIASTKTEPSPATLACWAFLLPANGAGSRC
jgi:hypothetical protein